MESRRCDDKRSFLYRWKGNCCECRENDEGKKVFALIVKARDADDAYGVITRKDVVNKIIATGKDAKKVTVHEIMTKPLITVSPGLAIKYCARLFAAIRIRRAPVFDGKKIVGMLSNSDILKSIEV